MLSSPRHHHKQILAAGLALWLAVFAVGGNLVPARAAAGPVVPAGITGSPTPAEVAPGVQDRLSQAAPDELIPVIVTLKDHEDFAWVQPLERRAARQEAVIRALRAKAEASQRAIRALLESGPYQAQVQDATYFWIFNGLALKASPQVIQALSERPEVASIQADEAFSPAPLSESALAAWDNVGMIGARQLWASGYLGQGMVVASLDTGVDYTHPELYDQWRKGSNSWFDPYGQHANPSDLPASCKSQGYGHGTATMGVMVGTGVGVAPQAQWIAAKIFDDNCTAYNDKVILALQWVLDPDRNPATADAPQVVNNSWGARGCDTGMVFQPALQALRAAGIVPVFSAGNYYQTNPADSDAYPANYPEAFAVGATDRLDGIAYFSSRGPNTCVTPPATFPALAAPGLEIYTTGPGSTYVTVNGTSFSAPHVAGTLALLLQAHPGLTVAEQETALTRTAVDLGEPGMDNTYGYGRLDAYAAYQWITEGLPLANQFFFPMIWQQIEPVSPCRFLKYGQPPVC